VNGLEYLQQVMYEAKRCPRTVVAEIDRSLLVQKPIQWLEDNKKMEERKEFLPSEDWQTMQVSNFSSLRLRMERRKNLKDEEILECPPRESGKAIEVMLSEEPLVSTLAGYSQASVALLLTSIMEHLAENDNDFPESIAKWTYSLLSVLEEPVEPGVFHIIRELVRIFSRMRSRLQVPDDPMVIRLNLLICIITRYFNQVDLLNMAE